MIKEIENNDFSEVEASEKALVDFNADWCGPCQALAPTVEEVSNELENVDFFSVNIDENEELAEKFSVVSIPCLVVFENGKEVSREIGVLSKKKLLKFLGEK